MSPPFARRAAVALLALACAAPACADDRKAADVVKQIDAIKLPPVPQDRNDQKAVRDYIEARQKAMDRRAALTLDLFRADPNNDRLPGLFAQRWSSMPPIGPQAAELDKELTEVAAGTRNEKLRAEAGFFKARAALFANRAEPAKALDAIDAFIKANPEDERGGQLLYAVASQMEDGAKKEEVEDRLLKDFPEGQIATLIKATRRRREAIGKPFELAFEEAITGKEISMADLKGKVVVVDFWATWCGPCVAEMPKMKDLYKQYKDQGVEFVGVSLDNPEDQGGLKSLKEFVAEKEIPWPQYYQGNGWESEFSGNWGINSIPCVFIVDADGNLASTEARGKLEELIPELLQKAKKE